MTVPRVDAKQDKISENLKPTRLDRAFYGVTAVAFVSVMNLFWIAGVSTLLAAVAGWLSGKFLLKKINDRILEKKLRLIVKTSLTIILFTIAVGAVAIAKAYNTY